MMQRLRVGIDGLNLALPHGTGVATYGLVLAEVLRAQGHGVTGVFGIDAGARPAAREVLFFDRLHKGAELSGRPRWLRRIAAAVQPLIGSELHDVPMTGIVERSGFADRLPVFDRLVSATDLFRQAHAFFDLYGRFMTVRMADPPGIMHWTYPIPLRLAGARNIYTLHDLVPLRLPHATLDHKRKYLRLLNRCVAEAAHLCTVSDASRVDIEASFPAARGRITNSYQASPIDAAVLARDADEDARMVEAVLGLRRDGYFLFYGAIEPKKNVGRLIEAYLATGSQTPLVIVGRAWKDGPPDPRGGAGVGGALYGTALPDRVIRLDYLPRDLLLRLVRGARAVAFPSLYEGFGLPVLEAMMLGTPVLSSRTSAIPEVTGDAAILVDPLDVQAIADGLIRIDQDPAMRGEMRARGMAQAQLFSRERYAERLEAMYARIMSAPAV